ncbi:hypothetical protein QBC34DRAFT_498199 [Podospora aff. communis PSN243]|uniref:NACHT domain-containing protein n=1 Tax=Podospora aff. communis PSN243 TaxID=3040156 RepID=A0AAV9G902_9PEZI|nr:hypothetical protein QBC34DRAFT_498199 [Podospora aff. communis PSN243]
MSGLEALAALGLACNVFQVVSFTGEVCKTAKTIFETGVEPDPAAPLSATLESLTKAFDDIEKTASSARQAMTAQDKELVRIAKECTKAALDLKAEVDKREKTTVSAKGNLVKSAFAGIRGAMRARKLEGLEKMVDAHRGALETRLLAQICSKADALTISQHDSFGKLDATLRGFIQAFFQGETSIGALLSQESTSIKAHMTAEAAELKTAVFQLSQDTTQAHQGSLRTTLELNNNLAAWNSHAVDIAERERLLKSLKYPTMMERHNQIVDPHADTFEWIFQGLGHSHAEVELDPGAHESEDSEASDHDAVGNETDREASDEAVDKANDETGNETDKEASDSDNAVDKANDEASEETHSTFWTFDDEATQYGHSDRATANETDDEIRDAAIFDDGSTDDSEGDEAVGYDKSWSRREAVASFHRWAQEPTSQLFWVCGKPGSGKSTLMKFLADDPRTNRLLDSSLPKDLGCRTAIVSHFLWIASGHPMDAMIKGLLCSLVYQLLSELDTVRPVLEQYPRTRTKDYDSDWSEKELRDVLQFLLSRSPRPVCFFIDGLDEVHESDGQPRLLDLLRELRSHLHVKMCVSSRPEPILLAHLGNAPMFKMQDLTLEDIQSFATDSLAKAFRDSHLDFDRKKYQDLIFDVCTLAEGVFLWVALAVRSLGMGLDKRDPFDDMFRRLHILPRDLEKLYVSMWNRLGDDKDLYQKDAAVYLNLVLTDQSLPTSYKSLYWGDISLVEMLLASRPQLAKDILLGGCRDEEHASLRAKIGWQLEELGRKVDVRCAGLLEVKLPCDRDDGDPDFGDPDDSSHHAAGSIRFSHRSAMDFLQSSPQGKQLLEADDSTQEGRTRDLAMARMANIFVGPRVVRNSSSAESPQLDPWNAPGYVNSLWNDDHVSRTTADGLLAAMERSHRYREALLRCPHHDFHGVLALCCCTEFLDDTIRRLPASRPVPSAYAAYLFATILMSKEYLMGDEERLARKVDFLQRLSPMIDMGFRVFPCEHELRTWDPELDKGCVASSPFSRNRIPLTPLMAATLMALEGRMDEYTMPAPLFDDPKGRLCPLQSLLAGSRYQQHLSSRMMYPTGNINLATDHVSGTRWKLVTWSVCSGLLNQRRWHDPDVWIEVDMSQMQFSGTLQFPSLN